MRQIITHLLTNSLKFVEPGIAPRIHIWTEPIAALQAGAAIRLCVRDNGIGMPAQVQTGIFRPFQRGTSDPRYEGTGMGLALVQKGAERLGGNAGFRSKPGEGSCFWVDLLEAAP